MKLDAKAIRYLTSEDFRVLAAVRINRHSATKHRSRHRDIAS